jgi:hypothetical protein
MSHHLWGYGADTGTVLIAVNIPIQKLYSMYERVDTTIVSGADYAMPWRRSIAISVCRGPKYPIE